MLITFKSRASPDVLMLADLATYLLGIVGKRLSPRGVIARDELSNLTFRTSRTQFGANFVASPAGERRLPGRRVA